MGKSDGESPREEVVKQCMHKRLLERVKDHRGESPHMMQCCECGAIVQRSS
jgi:hypothetical protein